MSDKNQNPEGEIRPTGRLVAVKNPSPPRIEINTHDSIGLSIKEKAILHGTGKQTEAVRVSDSEGISSAVDVTETGRITQSVRLNKGQTPKNEQGGEEACRTLIELLNLIGDFTIEPTTLQRVQTESDDADFFALNGNQKVRFQVTRGAPEQKFWLLLSRFLKHDHESTTAESCADGIRDSIQRKANKISTAAQREQIILVIDAMHSPALATIETINTFRRKHGTWATALRFRSIWVVGPVSSLTHCVSRSE
jgi:hypothetical protein